MTRAVSDLPGWALELLRCPQTGEALHRHGDSLQRGDGSEVGRVEGGIARFSAVTSDDNVRIYRELGGAHFFERAQVPFAMSALDTPVYHDHLGDVRPKSLEATIVDIGGGDGRNARPWLEQGFQRIIVVDAVAASLARFRERIAADAPNWIDRVLMIEGDARFLPLRSGCAAAVLAIESLYYLNEDYESGLRQCVRILQAGGKLLLSERDWECGLLLRLLYDGISGMLDASRSRMIVDGTDSRAMRTRCFTEAELTELLARNHLKVCSVRGTSALALVLGWLANRQLIEPGEIGRRDEAISLLRGLASQGHIRRCHIVVAERFA